ncbi:MAG: AAA family ATPase, partial [Myxococcales bacterium]|nr:AAA family ATPase [Myxococcales bacterium]
MTLLDRSAMDLARMVRRREVSPVELVDAHIAQIEAVNPSLNAVIATRYDQARAEARAAERQVMQASDPASLPPLLGLPHTAKEYIMAEGMPLTAGVWRRRGVRAERDATTVARLRRAGAILVGITNVPEGGLWMETYNDLYGRTVNPWSAAHTAGGSSGGEGAIVAAGGVAFGLGADVGGSIRIPAAFCGTVGHKPTGRLVPNTGFWPPAGEGDLSGYLVCGPLTRRVEDVMPILRVLAGPDGEDRVVQRWDLGDPAQIDLRDVTVYPVPSNGFVRVSARNRAAVADAAQALRARGARIATLDAPRMKKAFPIWAAMMATGGGPAYTEVLGDGTPISPARELGRLLLGRPSPWLGRGPQVDRMLLEYFDAVFQREPRAVLLQAEAGMGKSRLAQEFVSGLETGASPPLVWIARGDPVSAGAPFSLLGQVLSDMAGIVAGENERVRRTKLHRCLGEYFSGPQLRRMEAFLGELCGTRYPADFCLPLLVARQDPQFMAAQTRRAWEDLVAVVTTCRPLVIVLDDCQWGDLASLRYCDGVLRSAETRALMLVAMTRPGASMWSSPEAGSRFVRVELQPLPDDVCAAFLREVLGEQADPGLARRLTRRSGGNPLHLEELARAVGQSGSEHVEDTIAAMMQSRLLSLGFDARQILRAASVFGPVFWLEGVVALRREGSSAALVREWLDELIAQEIVVRRSSSRFPAQEEYEFHHLSMQEAAYGMLTAEDRRAAHRTVAHWLGAHGESNSYVLAEHHRRGGDAEAAARCYEEAARQAFARNEFEAVLEITERGLACAARGKDRGSLLLLRAEVEALSGRHGEASRSALEAMVQLPSTSPRWLAAAGEASLASARAGLHDKVLEVIARIDEFDPVQAGGGVELTGLVRAALPLAAAGHGHTALRLLDSVERALRFVA